MALWVILSSSFWTKTCSSCNSASLVLQKQIPVHSCLTLDHRWPQAVWQDKRCDERNQQINKVCLMRFMLRCVLTASSNHWTGHIRRSPALKYLPVKMRYRAEAPSRFPYRASDRIQTKPCIVLSLTAIRQDATRSERFGNKISFCVHNVNGIRESTKLKEYVDPCHFCYTSLASISLEGRHALIHLVSAAMIRTNLLPSPATPATLLPRASLPRHAQQIDCRYLYLNHESIEFRRNAFEFSRPLHIPFALW